MRFNSGLFCSDCITAKTSAAEVALLTRLVTIFGSVWPSPSAPFSLGRGRGLAWRLSRTQRTVRPVRSCGWPKFLRKAAVNDHVQIALKCQASSTSRKTCNFWVMQANVKAMASELLSSAPSFKLHVCVCVSGRCAFARQVQLCVFVCVQACHAGMIRCEHTTGLS